MACGEKYRQQTNQRKRGEEKITLAKTEPINGENIKLSIDSKLQENIYAQMNNDTVVKNIRKVF